MAEEELITIVDVENPDDESFACVRTVSRPLTDEELNKMKPFLKNAGAYRFFKMDLGFADLPAVKQFIDTVKLDPYRRTEKHKIVQENMTATVAGREVVINAALIQSTFGLANYGIVITRPNKKSIDLHSFYIKPVFIPKCRTKRGISVKHFKSEYSYISNFARQVQMYCCGLLPEGFLNYSQFKALDWMIRRKPVNWNRYLLQNFQDRVRKFRKTPFNLYFGGTLTALIYNALGVDYKMAVTAANKVPMDMIPSKEKSPLELVSCSEAEEANTSTRTSVRRSTLLKRKAMAAMQLPPKKPRPGPKTETDDILNRFTLDVKLKKKKEKARRRPQPPRPVTMGKLELLTKFSHRGPDLDNDTRNKLTTMYYTATETKPRRKADLAYQGKLSLTEEEVRVKCEEYYALEEELLLEHILAKEVLEKAVKRFGSLKDSLVRRDRELTERVSVEKLEELEYRLKAKSEEVLEAQAELDRLREDIPKSTGENEQEGDGHEVDVQGGEA